MTAMAWFVGFCTDNYDMNTTTRIKFLRRRLCGGFNNFAEEEEDTDLAFSPFSQMAERTLTELYSLLSDSELLRSRLGRWVTAEKSLCE